MNIDMDRTGILSLWLAAFSLLLTLLAFWTDPVLNRDGMYYVHLARLVADGQSLDAGAETWTFLSLFLGWCARWLSVDALYVAIAYAALCGLLMQLFTFHLLLRIDRTQIWLALLVAAAFPAFTEYRDYVIRDAGAWAAMLGAMSAMTSWWTQPRARYLAVALLLGLLAFLCRAEMIVVLAAGGLVWLRGLHGRGQFGSMSLSLVLLLAALAGLLALAALVYAVGLERMQFYWSQTGGSLLHNFDQTIDRISPEVISYLADDLPLVLGSGLLVMLVGKLVSLNGLFVVPLIAGIRRQLLGRLGQADGGLSLMLAAMLLLVLLLFLFVNLFMSARYVVPLSLALLPLVYLGLIRLAQRFPAQRWQAGFAVIALLVTLAHVISTGPGKRYLIEAGNWIAGHRAELGELYFTDQRVAFYADEGYNFANVRQTLDEMPDGVTTVVLSYRAKGASEQQVIDQLRKQSGFARILHRSGNGDGDGVLVLAR